MSSDGYGGFTSSYRDKRYGSGDQYDDGNSQLDDQSGWDDSYLPTNGQQGDDANFDTGANDPSQQSPLEDNATYNFVGGSGSKSIDSRAVEQVRDFGDETDETYGTDLDEVGDMYSINQRTVGKEGQGRGETQRGGFGRQGTSPSISPGAGSNVSMSPPSTTSTSHRLGGFGAGAGLSSSIAVSNVHARSPFSGGSGTALGGMKGPIPQDNRSPSGSGTEGVGGRGGRGAISGQTTPLSNTSLPTSSSSSSSLSSASSLTKLTDRTNKVAPTAAINSTLSSTISSSSNSGNSGSSGSSSSNRKDVAPSLDELDAALFGSVTPLITINPSSLTNPQSTALRSKLPPNTLTSTTKQQSEDDMWGGDSVLGLIGDDPIGGEAEKEGDNGDEMRDDRGEEVVSGVGRRGAWMGMGQGALVRRSGRSTESTEPEQDDSTEGGSSVPEVNIRVKRRSFDAQEDETLGGRGGGGGGGEKDGTEPLGSDMGPSEVRYDDDDGVEYDDYNMSLSGEGTRDGRGKGGMPRGLDASVLSEPRSTSDADTSGGNQGWARDTERYALPASSSSSSSSSIRGSGRPLTATGMSGVSIGTPVELSTASSTPLGTSTAHGTHAVSGRRAGRPRGLPQESTSLPPLPATPRESGGQGGVNTSMAVDQPSRDETKPEDWSDRGRGMETMSGPSAVPMTDKPFVFTTDPDSQLGDSLIIEGTGQIFEARDDRTTSADTDRGVATKTLESDVTPTSLNPMGGLARTQNGQRGEGWGERPLKTQTVPHSAIEELERAKREAMHEADDLRRKLARALIEAEDARAQVTQLKDQLHDEQIAHAAMIRAHAAAVSAQDDRLRSAVRAAKEETETRMRELMDQQDKLHRITLEQARAREALAAITAQEAVAKLTAGLSVEEQLRGNVLRRVADSLRQGNNDEGGNAETTTTQGTTHEGNNQRNVAGLLESERVILTLGDKVETANQLIRELQRTLIGASTSTPSTSTSTSSSSSSSSSPILPSLLSTSPSLLSSTAFPQQTPTTGMRSAFDLAKTEIEARNRILKDKERRLTELEAFLQTERDSIDAQRTMLEEDRERLREEQQQLQAERVALERERDALTTLMAKDKAEVERMRESLETKQLRWEHEKRRDMEEIAQEKSRALSQRRTVSQDLLSLEASKTFAAAEAQRAQEQAERAREEAKRMIDDAAAECSKVRESTWKWCADMRAQCASECEKVRTESVDSVTDIEESARKKLDGILKKEGKLHRLEEDIERQKREMTVQLERIEAQSREMADRERRIEEREALLSKEREEIESLRTKLRERESQQWEEFDQRNRELDDRFRELQRQSSNQMILLREQAALDVALSGHEGRGRDGSRHRGTGSRASSKQRVHDTKTTPLALHGHPPVTPHKSDQKTSDRTPHTHKRSGLSSPSSSSFSSSSSSSSSSLPSVDVHTLHPLDGDLADLTSITEVLGDLQEQVDSTNKFIDAFIRSETVGRAAPYAELMLGENKERVKSPKRPKPSRDSALVGTSTGHELDEELENEPIKGNVDVVSALLPQSCSAAASTKQIKARTKGSSRSSSYSHYPQSTGSRRGSANDPAIRSAMRLLAAASAVDVHAELGLPLATPYHQRSKDTGNILQSEQNPIMGSRNDSDSLRDVPKGDEKGVIVDVNDGEAEDLDVAVSEGNRVAHSHSLEDKKATEGPKGSSHESGDEVAQSPATSPTPSAVITRPNHDADSNNTTTTTNSSNNHCRDGATVSSTNSHNAITSPIHPLPVGDTGGSTADALPRVAGSMLAPDDDDDDDDDDDNDDHDSDIMNRNYNGHGSGSNRDGPSPVADGEDQGQRGGSELSRQDVAASEGGAGIDEEERGIQGSKEVVRPVIVHHSGLGTGEGDMDLDIGFEDLDASDLLR